MIGRFAQVTPPMAAVVTILEVCITRFTVDRGHGRCGSTHPFQTGHPGPLRCNPITVAPGVSDGFYNLFSHYIHLPVYPGPVFL